MAEEPVGPQPGAGTPNVGESAPDGGPAADSQGDPTTADGGELSLEQLLEKSEAENAQLRGVLENPEVLAALEAVRAQQQQQSPAQATDLGINFEGMTVGEALNAYHQMATERLPTYIQSIVGRALEAHSKPLVEDTQALRGRIARMELTSQLAEANEQFADLRLHKDELKATLQKYPGMTAVEACRVLGLKQKEAPPPPIPSMMPAGMEEGLERIEPLEKPSTPTVGRDSEIWDEVDRFFKTYGPPPISS